MRAAVARPRPDLVSCEAVMEMVDRPHSRRLAAVRAAVTDRVPATPERPAGVDALYVTQPHNRFYLTGFDGSSGYVLVTRERAMLLTDFRYVEQAAMQAPAFEVRRHGAPYLETLQEVAVELGFGSVAIEADHMTVQDREKLADALPGVELFATTGLFLGMRAIKDDGEIERIEGAVACADEAFSRLLGSGAIKPGVPENALAAELEYYMRLAGASRPAFDTIVASGPRSSLPHGRASSRRIEDGDLVTFDFGACVDGYCSDMTRTLVVGKASDEQRRVYDLVLQAQLAGVAAVRPGVTGRDVDAAARDLIAAAGHKDHFGHGLGHGIGLAVHEAPRLSPLGDDVLAPGMVTSVEPGVYVPGWGGVRIEDLVAVTQDGARILTKTPKGLIELR
jgi:Xaa-Pro aminopeptidase